MHDEASYAETMKIEAEEAGVKAAKKVEEELLQSDYPKPVRIPSQKDIRTIKTKTNSQASNLWSAYKFN